MARRRRDDALAVSLFPFLSVLACVIGALILLLAAVALGRMSGAATQDIERGERMAELEEALERDRARLESLVRSVREAETREQEREALEEQLLGLGLSPDISLQELDGLLRLREEARRLEAEIEAQRALAAELAARLDDQEDALEALEKLQEGAPIIIDPSGFGRDLRPFLVECRSDHLILHRTSGDFTFKIPEDEVERGRDYRRFILNVKAIRRGIAIYLIRPDGVSLCQLAMDVADRAKVDLAKLPLPGRGRIDLGRFE